MPGATDKNIIFSEKGNWQSRLRIEEDEVSIRHAEFEVPVNLQSGNVQRYLDIQVWSSGDSFGLEFHLGIIQI